MNKDEDQFSEEQTLKPIPSLVDILNSMKEPKPVTRGIPNLKDLTGKDK